MKGRRGLFKVVPLLWAAVFFHALTRHYVVEGDVTVCRHPPRCKSCQAADLQQLAFLVPYSPPSWLCTIITQAGVHKAQAKT
jgi:hypothetical protein